MAARAVPMIHVPDVRATVDWYASVGFEVVQTHEDEGATSWALLAFGSSQVMFNAGGRPSTEHRREVDLYVYTEGLRELYERLKDRVELQEPIHDTFYGMREFIVRDINRFWITFAENVPAA